MPRSVNPYQYTNFKDANALQNLLNAVEGHFEDATQGDRTHKSIITLAVNELLTDCMEAFKALGILPTTINQVMNEVYGLNPVPAPKQPEPLPPTAAKQPEPAKKEGLGAFFKG